MTATEIADVLRSVLRGEDHPRASALRKSIVSVRATFGNGWDKSEGCATLTLDMGWGSKITIQVTGE